MSSYATAHKCSPFVIVDSPCLVSRYLDRSPGRDRMPGRWDGTHTALGQPLHRAGQLAVQLECPLAGSPLSGSVNVRGNRPLDRCPRAPDLARGPEPSVSDAIREGLENDPSVLADARRRRSLGVQTAGG